MSPRSSAAVRLVDGANVVAALLMGAALAGSVTAARGQVGTFGRSVPDSSLFLPVIDSSPDWLGCSGEFSTIAQEVRDPFFAFILTRIEAGALGRWSGAEIVAYVDSLGRASKIPLARIVSLEYREATASERQQRNGLAIERVWILQLDGDLEVPMPYSILGYNPGDLYISRRIVVSEWRLGTANLHLRIDEYARALTMRGLTVLRIDAGEIVLDVDGLIDRLLGKKLDDSWTQGFAVGRVDDRLVGLALSVGRKGRRIFGEFDFVEDKVIVHGRPVAAGMSRYCRPWVQPPPGIPSRAWQNRD